MLRMRLLGGMTLDEPAEAGHLGQQRKAMALLAVIAMAPGGGITREKLLGYFWPDAPEERGKNALRQRLFSLRREVPDVELVVGVQELHLNADAIAVDVWEFDAALAQNQPEVAATLYAGPFLDGVYFTELPELERWVEEVRGAIARRARGAFQQAADAAAARSDHNACIHWWQRAVELDPTAAPVVAGLLKAHATAGDVPGAMTKFKWYEQQMRREFDLPADPQVIGAVEELRRAAHSMRSNDAPRHATVSVESDVAINDVEGQVTPRSASENLSPVSVPLGIRKQPAWRRRALWVLLPMISLAMLYAARDAGRGTGQENFSTAPPARILIGEFVDEDHLPTTQALARHLQSEVTRALAREMTGEVLDARLMLNQQERASGLVPAARKFDTRFIVTGSVRTHGDSLTVAIQVVDGHEGVLIAVIPAATGLHVGRDSVVRSVIDRLAGTLTVLQDPIYLNSTGPLADPPTLEAYREYMIGIGLAGMNDFTAAMPHFLESFARDSTFTHAALWALETGLPDSTRHRLTALLEARRHTLAPIDKARFDFRVAYDARKLREAYRAAYDMARIAPNSNHALHTFALMAMETRQLDEAVSVMRRVDPDAVRSPHWASFFELGSTIFEVAGDIPSALRFARATARLLPNPLTCTGVLALRVADGAAVDAVRQIPECVRLSKSDTLLARLNVHFNLARALASHGFPAVADSLLRSSVQIAESGMTQGAVGPRRMAEIYADGGRHADAVRLYVQQHEREGDEMLPAHAATAAIAALRAGDSARYATFTHVVYSSKRPRPRHLYTARIAVAAGLIDSALASLAAFEQAGGLVIRQLHGDPHFRPLWNRPEWHALFAPLPSSDNANRPPVPGTGGRL